MMGLPSSSEAPKGDGVFPIKILLTLSAALAAALQSLLAGDAKDGLSELEQTQIHEFRKKKS